jgi:hypothetical protein
MGVLTQEKILELHAAAVSAGLAQSRNALLAGVDTIVRSRLPTAANPSDQILCDLGELNSAGATGDESPLLVWLANASSLARARKEFETFRSMLEVCRQWTPVPVVRAKRKSSFFKNAPRRALELGALLLGGAAAFLIRFHIFAFLRIDGFVEMICSLALVTFSGGLAGVGVWWIGRSGRSRGTRSGSPRGLVEARQHDLTPVPAEKPAIPA